MYGRLYGTMERTVNTGYIEIYRLLSRCISLDSGKQLENSMRRERGMLPLQQCNVGWAESVLLTALDDFEKFLGRLDPETIRCSRALGECYIQQNKYGDAQAYSNASIANI